MKNLDKTKQYSKYKNIPRPDSLKCVFNVEKVCSTYESYFIDSNNMR